MAMFFATYSSKMDTTWTMKKDRPLGTEVTVKL